MLWTCDIASIKCWQVLPSSAAVNVLWELSPGGALMQSCSQQQLQRTWSHSFTPFIHFCQSPLWVRSAKRRHHSPEWMILSHVNCFVQAEVQWFQILLGSLHPRSTGASRWSPPVLHYIKFKVKIPKHFSPWQTLEKMYSQDKLWKGCQEQMRFYYYYQLSVKSCCINCHLSVRRPYW